MQKKALFVLFLCFSLLLSACSLIDVAPSLSTEANSGAQIDESTIPSSESATEEFTDPTDTSVPDATAPSTAPSIVVPQNSSFEVHYIDVGQADAALVLCDGHAMLIDGGNSADSSLIYAYLKQRNITFLDYIVCTHAHEDHVGGLAGALNYASVGTAFAPVAEYDTKAFQNFTKYLSNSGVSITIPNHGDTFDLGTAKCQIIGPVYPTDEPNSTSIVIKITFGETSFLFTGDAETEEERSIIDQGYDISCTVLKVGHHGSDTSTSYLWLRESSPDYAIISVGADNSYGHPTEATLSKLRDADVKTFRTDMQGHVVCISDGKSVSFSVERNPEANTLIGAGNGGNHTTEEPDDPSSTEASYILNTNTKKFHYPNCSSVDQMSDKNKQEVTSSRDEIIDQGYSPCGRCNP